METFFSDEFINKVVLKRLIKEVKKEQISKTVKNIEYFEEIRKKLNKKHDFTPSQNEELESLRRNKYAKRNLQA